MSRSVDTLRCELYERVFAAHFACGVQNIQLKTEAELATQLEEMRQGHAEPLTGQRVSEIAETLTEPQFSAQDARMVKIEREIRLTDDFGGKRLRSIEERLTALELLEAARSGAVAQSVWTEKEKKG